MGCNAMRLKSLLNKPCELWQTLWLHMTHLGGSHVHLGGVSHGDRHILPNQMHVRQRYSCFSSWFSRSDVGPVRGDTSSGLLATPDQPAIVPVTRLRGHR